MSRRKWKALTKRDLVIEVWESLDCESVGALELLQIAEAVHLELGAGALDSVASMARVLADEGAELRHAEILELDATRRATNRYDAMFRNILKFGDFAQAERSLREMENLRRKFLKEEDKEGMRRLRQTALKGKRRAQMIASNQKVDESKRREKAEVARWFTIWLQTPEIFQDWLDLRKRSPEFQQKFAAESAESR